MRRLDRGDDRDMRADQARQPVDLAGMVHAELEDAIVGVARHARERQRHAPVIVEAADGGGGLALRFEGDAQRLLGAGLADAAGHAQDFCGRAVARRAAQGFERLLRVGDEDQGGVGGDAVGTAAGENAAGFFLQRRGDEIMAVEGRTDERDEKLARLHRAAVDRDAGRLPIAAGLAGNGVGDLVACPQRPHGRAD